MRMFNFREIFKRAFKTYDIWPQARSYTHTSAQCSPASVGLAQARPNNIYMYTVDVLIKEYIYMYMCCQAPRLSPHKKLR